MGGGNGAEQDLASPRHSVEEHKSQSSAAETSEHGRGKSSPPSSKRWSTADNPAVLPSGTDGVFEEPLGPMRQLQRRVKARPKRGRKCKKGRKPQCPVPYRQNWRVYESRQQTSTAICTENKEQVNVKYVPKCIADIKLHQSEESDIEKPVDRGSSKEPAVYKSNMAEISRESSASPPTCDTPTESQGHSREEEEAGALGSQAETTKLAEGQGFLESSLSVLDEINEEMQQEASRCHNYLQVIKPYSEQIRRIIESVAQSTFEISAGVHIQAAIYGSFATGMALPESDIDVLICGVKTATKQDLVLAITMLAEEIGKLAWIAECQPITTARVPVIKTVTLRP
jgi:predicted nucleotidyltransferase